MKVKRITLTVEPDNKLWGFSELFEDMGDAAEEEYIEAAIELVNEDFCGMFEDATWTVELDQTGRDEE